MPACKSGCQVILVVIRAVRARAESEHYFRNRALAKAPAFNAPCLHERRDHINFGDLIFNRRPGQEVAVSAEMGSNAWSESHAGGARTPWRGRGQGPGRTNGLYRVFLNYRIIGSDDVKRRLYAA